MSSTTRRLTVGQAIVEFLIAQHIERRRRRAAVLRRCVPHLRPRQRRRHRPGAAAVARTAAATTSRATSRRWSTPRSASPRGEPAADARLHHLDRAGRHQHDDRRRAGDDQPAAGAAAARRYLRDARPGARAAAAGVVRERRTCRSTTASSRCRSYWDRINRPEQLLTALPEAMRVLTSPAETGAVTLACRRTCRPRRSTTRRRCSASGSGRSRGPARTRSCCGRPRRWLRRRTRR